MSIERSAHISYRLKWAGAVDDAAPSSALLAKRHLMRFGLIGSAWSPAAVVDSLAEWVDWRKSRSLPTREAIAPEKLLR